MPAFRRKRNRLDPRAYEGCAAYSVTAATWRRRAAFAVAEVVDECLAVLGATAPRHCIEIPAYCFMPDHLHLLVIGGEESHLADFMRAFKQRSGFRCKRILGWDGPFWQKSYYDHVLRESEGLESVAAYIWGNPVRAGLSGDAGDYPFSGSLLSDEGRNCRSDARGGLKPSATLPRTAGAGAAEEVLEG